MTRVYVCGHRYLKQMISLYGNCHKNKNKYTPKCTSHTNSLGQSDIKCYSKSAQTGTISDYNLKQKQSIKTT